MTGRPPSPWWRPICANTYCSITEIYDQPGHGNNLTDAPAGGAANGPDTLANAAAAPTTAHGHKVYGVDISPGSNTWDASSLWYEDTTWSVATALS